MQVLCSISYHVTCDFFSCYALDDKYFHYCFDKCHGEVIDRNVKTKLKFNTYLFSLQVIRQNENNYFTYKRDINTGFI